MSTRCPRIICCGEDDPFANYTADRAFGSAQLYTAFGNEYLQPPLGSRGGWSCYKVCSSYESQQDASDCAIRQSTECVIQDQWEAPLSGQRLAALNTAQSCTKTCVDGTTFKWVVPAGTFAAVTVAEANRKAYERACYLARANLICLASVPEGCCYNLPFNFTLELNAGTLPMSWFTVGTLPHGISLVDADAFDRQAVLTGTPTVPGTYTFEVQAVTADLHVITKQIRMKIIEITPATLPDAGDGTPYSQQLTASGGVGPYKFEVAGGSLPPGFTLSEAGLLSGTTTPGGISYAFTIKATDQGT